MTEKNNNTPPPPDDKDFGRHSLTITITADLYDHALKITTNSSINNSNIQAVQERLRDAVRDELFRLVAATQPQHKQPQQPS